MRGSKMAAAVLAALLLIFTMLLGQAAEAEAKNPMVKLTTTKGDIYIEVFADKAPESAENFLSYVKDGFYDGLIFHRVIDGFMVQGGGLTPDMRNVPPKAPIKNESANGLKNDKYTVAMARTIQPHSATSQFFINVDDNAFLNRDQSRDGWGYAVFGKVVKGQDVVDAIKGVETTTKAGHQDVPVEPIVIEKAEVVEE